MNLSSFLTSAPKSIPAVWRHGFLVLGVGLFVWHVAWMGQHRWAFGDDRHRIFGFVLIALLLNHLAFRFSWPRIATILLRIVATAWLVVLFWEWFRVIYR